MNRLYYAMFYSILTPLINEQFASSKHKGVITFFNKKFIKEGIFPVQMGKSTGEAFKLRQTGDYLEYADLLPDKVYPFIEKAHLFIASIKKYLKI